MMPRPLELPRIVNAAFVAREVGDLPMGEEAAELHRRMRRRRGNGLEADMVRALLPFETLSEAAAAELWRRITQHRALMRAQLGRQVALQVAALDYLMGERYLTLPVLVEENALRKLVKGSTRDPLTGVLNRGAFEGMLERELGRARRYQYPVSLVMLDLDGLKQVNDTRGHPAGDSVLRRLGELLQEQMRSGDWCARYGGDEFAVIAGHTDEPGAARLALRILLQARRELADSVTLSAGVATMSGAAAQPDALIAAADAALYAAKRRGGDAVARASTLRPS
ncbi:MAG TPA: GGDEF domain-containing protein [Polyangiaceae bacterium]|nr:GGDEF domain-containing protein [Polyangiaceae bacterium]